MKISVIHATRGRHIQAEKTFLKWLRGSDDFFEYIVSVDSDDIASINHFKNFKGLTINPNHSAIEAINNGAKIATGDIFIIISDDTDCSEHWDTLLLKSLEGRYDFCAKTDDGIQPTLITMPVMDRKYYQRFNYIYHNSYDHMFCDQELTAIAIMTGKYIKLPLTFEHLHYSTGKSAYDEINRKNDASWSQGETLFNERLKTNFGIVDPVVPYSSIIWK